MMAKWVYRFGGGSAEGRADMRNLLGGKGANLAEMSNLGLPVPTGFTITTEVCTYYYDHGRSYPEELKAQVEKALDYVGKLTGRTFGDAENPLLVSVRSGARASMPGIETRAPERTETNSGFFGSPNFAPTISSIWRSAASTSAFSSGG